MASGQVKGVPPYPDQDTSVTPKVVDQRQLVVPAGNSAEDDDDDDDED